MVKGGGGFNVTMRFVGRRMISSLCFCTWAIWGLCSNARAADDPDVDWYEIETDHFWIHYPETKRAFAQKAIEWAEEAHKVLSPALGWEPREKTHIVVEGKYDDANGWARSTPSTEIHLYAYPPPPSSELATYDDWVRQLVLHEYTHILHTDNSRSSFYEVINALLGKVARNNATAPRWYTEGLAVYYETKTGTRGRLRNPVYRTIMRQAALSGTIPDLGRISTGMSRWPSGMGSYLFGAFFVESLALEYGDEKFAEFHAHYGDDWVPYGLNRAALKTWGDTLDGLYEAWRRKAAIGAQAEKLAWQMMAPTTPHRALVSPHRHKYPRSLHTKNAISYVKNDGMSGQRIVERNIESGKETDIVACYGECQHRWSLDDRQLYFVQSVVEDGYRTHNRLFVYDVESGLVRQVPDAAHIRAIAIDDEALYWVEQSDESTVVYRRRLGSDDKQRIYRSAPYEQIDDIDAWRGQIVASVFDPMAKQRDLFIFALHGSGDRWKRTRLTNSWESELSPYFSEDGAIYYVSDNAGMLNLWHFDRSTSQSHRLTHIIDGMMAPTASKSGDIYYIGYTPKGQALEAIESNDLRIYQTIHHENANDAEYSANHSNDNEKLFHSESPYKPYRWLWPQMWTPSVALAGNDTRIGALIARTDYAQHHSYSLSFGYYPQRNDFEYLLNYAWLGGLWEVGLMHGMAPGRSAYELKPGKYRYFDYQTIDASIDVGRTWNTRLSTHLLSIRYALNYQYAKDNLYWLRTDPFEYPNIPSLGWHNALAVSWSYSSKRQFERSMAAGEGVGASVSLRFEAPWLGADDYSLIARAGVSAAWTIPVSWLPQTVQIEGSGGTTVSTDENRQPFSMSIGQSGAYTATQESMLYGYPADSLYGSHYFYAKLSWHALIAEVDLGTSTLPIGINRLGVGAFTSWGYAWHKAFDISSSKYDIGAKLLVDYTIGYRQMLRMQLLYAWGGASEGGHAVVFMLGL